MERTRCTYSGARSHRCDVPGVRSLTARFSGRTDVFIRHPAMGWARRRSLRARRHRHRRTRLSPCRQPRGLRPRSVGRWPAFVTSRNYAPGARALWGSDIPAAKGTVRQSKVAVPGDDFPGSPANDRLSGGTQVEYESGKSQWPRNTTRRSRIARSAERPRLERLFDCRPSSTSGAPCASSSGACPIAARGTAPMN